MHQAVLIPGEKGQCGQQADQAHDQRQKASSSHGSGATLWLSWLLRGKREASPTLFTSLRTNTANLLSPTNPLSEEREGERARLRGLEDSPWPAALPSSLHQALDPRAAGTRQGTSQRLWTQAVHPARVGLLRPPRSTEGHQIQGHSLLSLPWGLPANLPPANLRFKTPASCSKLSLVPPLHPEPGPNSPADSQGPPCSIPTTAPA